ncbi:SRPBCC family protein [Amylibacter marinus]|nr:SRPBCC family protein [Amylibacter marinus]
MIHHSKELEINASVETVWATLARFMHIDEFAPYVTSVDALSVNHDGLGAKRRCHFDNGTSLVEQVIAWSSNHSYRVHLSEMDAMPLIASEAEIKIQALDAGRTLVTWSMDYSVKYGALGWLLGQTLMKMMMGKVLVANLKGLAASIT